MDPANQSPTTTDESAPPRQARHVRRPPLAEVDTWQLWLAWKRGEHRVVWPWLGLLLGFSVVLAGMYSFFYFTTSIDEDTIAQVVLTLVFIAFIFSLWRRISPRRDFALAVVTFILAASGLSFLLWLLAYRLSGWNWWAAIGGVAVLGIAGLLIGLTSLNVIAARADDRPPASGD